MKNIFLISLLIIGTLSAQADFIQRINLLDSQEQNSFTYNYNESAVNLTSDIQTFIDQVTGYKIVITNLDGGTRNISKLTTLSITVLNADFKILKIFKLPITATFYPYTVQSIIFYPTKVMDSKVIHGNVHIKTNKGDFFLGLKELTCNFIIYNKDFFDSKTEDIVIKEPKRK